MCPHPFVDFINAPLPAGEEIVLVDLRHLQEQVRHAPKAAALAALKQRRDEFRALGLSQADVMAGEQPAEEAATEEQTKQEAATREIDKLDATMPGIVDAAPQERFPAVVDCATWRPHQRTKDELRRYWARRKDVLRRQAGYLTRVEVLKQQAELAGASWLEWVNGGRVADAVAEVELPANERAKLPAVESFASRVRVLRARNV
jgi:hypothetical protein